MDGAADGVVDDGESGKGTAKAGAMTASGEGMDAACLNLISTPLRVPFNSERMVEEFEEPSFDCVNVSRSTLAYCTVYKLMSAPTPEVCVVEGSAHLPVFTTCIDRSDLERWVQLFQRLDQSNKVDLSML